MGKNDIELPIEFCVSVTLLIDIRRIMLIYSMYFLRK